MKRKRKAPTLEQKNGFLERNKALLEKIERYNDHLIPVALILLLFVIIFELFIHIENHALEVAIKVADYMVIAIFIIDLIFLALHSRTTRYFFRHYWLDILAVFPFGLIFTTLERFYRVVLATEQIVVTQSIAHEVLEARREIQLAARSEEELAKIGKLGRIMRSISRSLRFVTKSKFFTSFEEKRNAARKKFYKPLKSKQ
ncbi:MAG TPA: hypothetical protein VJI15_03400 [Candidatus Nanoarchaeia archaeon]|nr:hypothetical protein [Candidatus Nanoarchaeia archaeon]